MCCGSENGSGASAGSYVYVMSMVTVCPVVMPVIVGSMGEAYTVGSSWVSWHLLTAPGGPQASFSHLFCSSVLQRFCSFYRKCPMCYLYVCQKFTFFKADVWLI